MLSIQKHRIDRRVRFPQCPSLFRSYDSFVYENITPSFTELNNMEWNYLISPSQAHGKHCVHIVFFFTPFYLQLIGQWIFRRGQLTHVKSF